VSFERIFWSSLAVLVAGVLGTSSFFAYSYSDRANTRWISQWSQPYDLSIVKIGVNQHGTNLDSIKLVPTHGGEPIMRQRNMEPGLKLGYYDTVRFNKQTGQMRDTYQVEGQGYSPILCVIAALFFTTCGLVLVIWGLFALVSWLADVTESLAKRRLGLS
jgi:hypothetical protein